MDPLHNQILTALQRGVDWEVFEDCAYALLRETYPTLTPVPGGHDRGMDGAIGQAKGDPLPLVTTTGTDVAGNLKRNLNSYMASGREAKRVVIATLEPETGDLRESLRKTASALGFGIVAVHGQRDFADRLVHSPKWRKKLLGIPGDLPPLSISPPDHRRLVPNGIVGREDDITWLKGGGEDQLLIGQPGAGKTSALRELADSGNGLFLVSKDISAIADGIRQHQPETILVDDAHIDLELLAELERARRVMDANCRIVATAWPADRDAVRNALRLQRSAVRELGDLSRPQLKEIIDQFGIRGPDWLIREMLDQSSGKPGRTATLCFVVLQEGVESVVSAEGLYHDVRVSLRRLVGESAVDILATFALAGSRGLSMQEAANALQMTEVEMRTRVTKLAAGGVIEDQNGRFEVRPSALRHALIADAFFSGAASLSMEPVLSQVERLGSVVTALAGARARTRNVPRATIQRLLRQTSSRDAWRHYISLGPEEAEWVLTEHPDKLLKFGGEFLRHIPEKVLPSLLEVSAQDSPPPESSASHPWPLISEWVFSGRPRTDEAVVRRRLLLDAAIARANSVGNDDTTTESLCLALSPRFDQTKSDPVDRMSMKMLRGSLTTQELRELQSWWPEVRTIFRESGIRNWEAVTDLVRTWHQPGMLGGAASDEKVEMMESFAVQILEDLIPVMGSSAAMRSWAADFSKTFDAGLEVSTDPTYEVLYPSSQFSVPSDWKAEDKRNREKATQLGQVWSEEPPRRVAQKLGEFLQQRAALGKSSHGVEAHVCRQIATSSHDPMEWARTFFDEDLPSRFVAPLIENSIERECSGAETLLRKLLPNDKYRAAAVGIALRRHEVTDDTVQMALDRLEGLGEVVSTWCLRGEIPLDRLKLLLRHEDSDVVAAVARGVWDCEPKGEIPDLIEAMWERGVCEDLERAYPLKEIFPRRPHLARRWLVARSDDRWNFYGHRQEVFSRALDALTEEDKLQLLTAVDPSDYNAERLVRGLVGTDQDLYKELLEHVEDESLRLTPLEREPTSDWLALLTEALSSGHSPSQVVAFLGDYVARRSRTQHEQWLAVFKGLETHDDPSVRAVGLGGRKRVENLLAQDDDNP